MTFEDDFMVLNFDGDIKRMFCKLNGFSWPPPESIEIGGFTLKRVRMSSISDEDRAGMTHVCRGAEYKP